MASRYTGEKASEFSELEVSQWYDRLVGLVALPSAKNRTKGTASGRLVPSQPDAVEEDEEEEEEDAVKQSKLPGFKASSSGLAPIPLR